MKSLLKIVTECIDKFSLKENIERLAGLKLMAGGIQNEEDIRNLFVVMDDSEKKKTWELARLIRRDKNLSKILSSRKRPGKIDTISDLEMLKIDIVQGDDYKPKNE